MDAQEFVGQQVDRYYIQQHIARGGMADVYLAQDIDLKRKVALKIMLDVLAQDPHFVQRFHREAQTVAQLDHPSIIQVYRTGLTPSRQPYIAMQFIEGGSLQDNFADWMERGKLAPTIQALAIVRQLAAALHVAHNAGVVHRDLKPGNVLIRPDGTPVLVDLGIAAIRGGAKLTQTGNLMGTPHYMSPEQVRSLPLDGRSDLYSLGVILYELLSGIRPFEAEESIAILHKHVYEAPIPLSVLRSDLSPQTQTVVETCLQKDPAHRYQTAAEMIAAIDQALAAEGSGSHIPRTTVLSTEGEGELISRRRVVRLPGEDKPASRFKPVWGMAIIAIFILAVAAYNQWRSKETNVSTFTAATQPAPIPTAEGVAQDRAQPTSTIGPTFTPLPTATPEPSPTPTAEPTATLEPTATDISNSFSPAITGNDGMTMRLVPAGNFMMGSTLDQVNAAIAQCRLHPDGDSCAPSEFNIEIPQHTIYVSAFYMDETEVTNSQYHACVDAGGCAEPDSGSGRYRRSEYYDRSEFASYPVVWVSWFDARAYCAWAGKRLPTEAEWEKAARGEDGRIFPWGNDFSSNLANTQERGQESLTPVGQYPAGATPYGILDMAGSVWEYVADWFDPAYYASAPASDPPGPASSPSGDKVVRSGSYANFQHYARVANRGFVAPDTTTQFRGIRCVVDASVVEP